MTTEPSNRVTSMHVRRALSLADAFSVSIRLSATRSISATMSA